MSQHLDFSRARIALVGILVCLVFAAVPIAAKAAPVGLGTAEPFVVLGGAGVTNTGASVLNGDLGVSPGTALSGFGLPAVVNGATHANDAVAAQAQADLGTAYDVAAGQAIAPGNELTGVDLGGLALGPGAYNYSSSAQLTGQLTLDAHGDPNAQFVFVIGTTLTTATASSVILVNGASPCNVYWKVGSSATLGTSTSFQGNVLALTSISLNSSVTVLGRMLARNGAVTLISDVLTAPGCATGSTPPATEPGSGGTTGTGTPTATGTPTGTSATPTKTANGGKKKTAPGRKPSSGNAPSKDGTAKVSRGSRTAGGVTATVHGTRIATVTVTDNGVRVGSPGAPRKVRVAGTPGVHRVIVRVTFNDATPAKTFRFQFRVPTPVLHPEQGPSQFTG
jgi:Ice-binding-like